MEPDQVKQQIEAGLPDCNVTVTGENAHFDATVIGEVFAGLSPVKKQQLVYATVNDQIASGEVHALTIKTYTPAEWEKASKLRVS